MIDLFWKSIFDEKRKEQEFASRRAQLAKQMMEDHLDAVVLFNRINIIYYAGLAHQQTERPIALVIPKEGSLMSFIPRLEADHLQEYADIEAIIYSEYPGDAHPMEVLTKALKSRGFNRLGVDADGYGSYWGYSGPRLSECLPASEIISLLPAIRKQRAIKSPWEIENLRLSTIFGNLAHQMLVEEAELGCYEIEVGQRATTRSSRIVVQSLAGIYQLQDWGVTPTHTGLKSGPQTAYPHPMAAGKQLEPGDLLVTWATADINGYRSELERTLVMGEPTDDQRYYFEVAKMAQEVAFEALGPGVLCREIDEKVQQFFRDRDCGQYVRHHTGHSFGLEIHESPFLDTGEQEMLQPGMVVSVEPGLYVPGVGGFRPSDTVLITEDGADIMTYFPRELDDLIIQ